MLLALVPLVTVSSGPPRLLLVPSPQLLGLDLERLSLLGVGLLVLVLEVTERNLKVGKP